MKTRFNMPKGLSKWLTIGMLTVCACLLTIIALPDFSTIETYALQDSNTSMTDFYERAAAHSGIAELDTNVTVVAIDDCSHDDIAEVLDMVNTCRPRAIGLDVLFYSLDNDTLLKAALKEAAPLLTLPLNDGERLPSQSFVNKDTLTDARFGLADLVQEHRSVPIRQYFLSVGSEPSFVKQLALAAGYDIHDLNETEPLRYGAKEIYTVSAREMLDEGYFSTEDFHDKIVLIGTTNDPADQHYTPIDHSMPGVTIHAYSLATLISGNPVKSMPIWVLYTIALLFTAATIWLCMRVEDHPYSNLVSRIIPLGIILLFIYISYHCYNSNNCYIDFTIVLAMTASGMVCYDLYTGVPSLIKAFWRRLSNTKH